MSGIGKVIQNLREEMGMSQGELVSGLCSDSTLSRIEWEERVVEQWLIDAILQRLGKSSDKFWTIINVRDYNILVNRNRIWENILSKRYEEAKEGLEEYRKNVDIQEPLHQQYIMKCKGLMYGKEGNWQKSVEILTEAVQVTVWEFGNTEKIESLLIGRDEMLIILLLAEGYEQLGKRTEAKQLVRGLLQNIEQRKWDEEELVKIYPKVIWYYVKFLKEENQYEQVIFYARKAADMLRENGVIFLLEDLISCIVWGMERRNEIEQREFSQREKQEYMRLKRHVKVLNEIWSQYGKVSKENMIYCTNVQKDISTSNEIIRKCRKKCRLSQETLSEEICTVENLSRIENGKISPQEKNYRGLMEKMSQAIERDRGIINVPDYELREELRMVSKHTSQMEYYKAEQVWKKLRGKIPGDSLENQQCILRYDTLISYGKKEIDWKEATKRYEAALKMTMPDFGQIDISEWPLSRTEIFLLNNIASGYYTIGKKKEAKGILMGLKRAFDRSMVDVRYRMTEYIVLVYNIGMLEKLEGNVQKASRIFEKGLYLELQSGRFTKISKLLYGLGWAMRNSENDKKARKIIEQAFYFSDIQNLPNLNNDIYRYYQKNWNDTIID